VWRFFGVQGQPNKKLEKKQKKMVIRFNLIVDAIKNNSIGVKEIEKFKMQMIERTT